MIAIDKILDRAKYKRGSEIKRLKKRVGFPPKTGIYFGKSDPEEEPDPEDEAVEPMTPPPVKKKL